MMESIGYSAPVALVACPFCREMFEAGEVKQCPLCGVAVTAFEKLPASAHLVSDDGVPPDPTEEVLPFTYLGRGRGLLVGLAIAGMILFFLPWMHTTLPNIDSYSGFDISKKLGWTWGACISWFVLLPTILSRRTIFHMRGARVAAAFLSAVPTLTAAILLLRPPQGGPRIPLEFTYQWPLFAAVFVGVLGIFTATRLGGRADDIKVKRGNATGHTLH
jgi:hypothetical protein